jgi:hypothetical protein
MAGLPTSNAYEAFEACRREVRLLRASRWDRSAEARERTNAGNRAATVLLCSHLEGYVEEVFLEGWEFVEGCDIPVEQLPVDLRRLVFVVEGRTLMDGRHDPGFADRIEAFFSSWGHLLESGTAFDLKKSRVECLTDRINVPNPENICELFRAYGIPDIFGSIERATDGKLRSEELRLGLGDMINKRHGIAHGESTVIPTALDVARYSDVTKCVCRHIDVVLGERLQEICGMFPWSGTVRDAAVQPPGWFPDWLA